MGLFKKAKKKLKGGTKSFVNLAKATVKGDLKQGLVSATDFTSLNTGNTTGLVAGALGGVESKGKFISNKSLEEDSKLARVRFQQEQADITAKEESDEEKKRRRRRGNIFTQPLGSLVSRALTTRNLTGA